MPTTLRQANEKSNWALCRQVVLDLLFPPRCLACERRGAWLCEGCEPRLPRLPLDRCVWCGRPIGGRRVESGTASPSVCAACRASHAALDGLIAGYSFDGPIRVAVHRLKYRRARHLAEPLGDLMAEALAAADAEVEGIVPVPLHPVRARERGYNQAELLARRISERTGFPVFDGVLERTRPTQSQMSLPSARRAGNVAGAFAPASRALPGRRLLLVDDVCTTGSTLEACAVALRKAGCTSVWGLTLARVR